MLSHYFNIFIEASLDTITLTKCFTYSLHLKLYYVTFQYSVTFCNKAYLFLLSVLLLKLLWDKSVSSFYGQKSPTKPISKYLVFKVLTTYFFF